MKSPHSPAYLSANHVYGNNSMPTTLSTFAIQTLSLVLFFLLPYHADAFKINPYAKYKNGKYVGGALSPEPVHENLTVHSLSQVSTMYLPQNTTSLRTELISGVRWNDDPLSMLKTRLINYAINFEHSCADSISPQIDPRWDYLYRTHCGDMQYLHAMASKPDEHYNDTLNKMMMWLEFTYKVSSNKISPSRRLRSVHELLSDTSRQLFYKHITNQGSKYRCALGKNGKENCAVVRTLFTLECHRALFHKLPKCKSNDSASPTTVMNIALGSGLHVLQDSLSDSHVARLGSPTDRCSPRDRKSVV